MRERKGEGRNKKSKRRRTIKEGNSEDWIRENRHTRRSDSRSIVGQ